MIEKCNKHIPSGTRLTLGHVLVAAELQADQGDWIGFSTILDVDSHSRQGLETAVLSWAKEREYDVADLVTWMDTEQAQHFVNGYFDRWKTPHIGEIGDLVTWMDTLQVQDFINGYFDRWKTPHIDESGNFFPSVADLRSDADKWGYGWESVADGDSWCLVTRGDASEYVLGHDFEYCAQRCYSNVDVPTPRTRQDWKRARP